MKKTEAEGVAAVVGAGSMGHGIAQVFAQGGWRVRTFDLSPPILRAAESRILSNLNLLSARGLEKPELVPDVMARIESTSNLPDALAGADFVIESVSEDLRIKADLFEQIEAYVAHHTIIGSNTSMLKISDIGKKVERKGRILVTHWFNPPYLMPAVEIVKGHETDPDVVERAANILESLGKVPVRLLKEVPGHLLNRIQFAIFRETLELLQEGVATPEEIDKGVSASLGLRLAAIGPLRSIDLTGLDMFVYNMKDIYLSLSNALEPQQVIRERVQAGQVGRKSGKGFFEYQTGDLTSKEERDRDNKLISILVALRNLKEQENGR